MSRSLAPLALLLALTAVAAGQDPVERALGVQQAIALAETHLAADRAAEAVAVLEAQLPNADGRAPFLDALRRAYAAELKHLDQSPNADRAAALARRLTLLGAEPTTPVAVVLPETAPGTGDARALFNEGKYADAAAKFAAQRAAGSLTPDEAAAWAYCRIRVAADAVNPTGCDPTAAAAAEADVIEALKLAPGNAELARVGKQVQAVARARAGNRVAPALSGDWETVETPSFRVRHKGNKALADAVAAAAEAKRTETFTRWSGPPGGPWAAKCEIVLHPTLAGGGHATVKLAGGRATERRLDLRADDATLIPNALPRELTHVVLADLFPNTPPPKWAEEGMAVLAGSPDEVSRYVRTLSRCARGGELLPTAALLDLTDFPAADKVTGFYCASVTLVDYLVKLKGEQHFLMFLRDTQRYGTAQALRRQYDLDGPAGLEAAWRRATLAP